MSRKKTPLIGPEVLFRYRVISAVRALELQGQGRDAAVRAVAAAKHHTDQEDFRAVSARTLYRWLASYEELKLKGLGRKSRRPDKASQVLSPGLLAFLGAERTRDRDASIPELLKRAELYRIVESAKGIDRSTVWRAMVRLGIETRRRKQPVDADTRRFRYAERMQMVLVDFKHFRAGVSRARRLAIYMLDDATRYGLGMLVTTGGEAAIVVLRMIEEVVRRFGLMDVIYWDGGPGFKDHDVEQVVVRLKIHPVRGRAHYPEGHGAIERFNRSLKARELRTYDGAVHVDPDPGALTLRLQHDLEIYNDTPHGSLDNETPQQRWDRSTRALEPVESEDWLLERFTLELERRVSNDHVVKVDGVNYEVPRGHAGEWVTLQRRLLERTEDEDALYIPHQDHQVRLHPVDLAFNAQSGRARPDTEEDEVAPVPAKSASTLSFERTYQNMLGHDGGYPELNKED